MRNSIARAAALVGAAVVGLLVAHELDYRLLVPDPLHRHDLLLRTGHGYLSRAVFIVLAAGLVATIASIAVGAVRGREDRTSSLGFGATAALLAIVQSGGFVALEASERLIVGAPPDDRLWLVTLVGIAVQVVVAVGVAAFLRVLEGTIAAVVRALSSLATPARSARIIAGPRAFAAPRTIAAGTVGARAPPHVV